MKDCRLFVLKFFFFIVALSTIVSCNEKKKYDGFLYPIRENGLYGYIDSVGNRIIEPQFLWVSTFNNGLAMAIVDTIYREYPDSIAFEVGERDSVVNEARMYVKYGYIEKNGRFAIEPTYITYVTMPEKGYIVSDMDGCSRALSRHTFRNKRAMFCNSKTWKYGYINQKGEIEIEAKYYYSEPFFNGRAIVKELVGEPVFYDDLCLYPSKLRCSYIDTLGNSTTMNKYEKLTKFNGRRGIGSYTEIISDSLGNKKGYTVHNDIIDGNGNLIKDLGIWNTFYDYSKDGISVARQVMHFQVYDGMFDSYSFVDEEGHYLQPLKGLSVYQLDSLNKCNDIIEVLPEDASIADATSFNDGFAGISPDCKHWFVIDKYLIIHGYGKESIFEDFRPFGNGLAAVKRNGKWGYINKTIKEQIPCKYDSCGFVYPCLEEIFEYDIQGNITKAGYINRIDSLVWESKIPKSGEIKNIYSVKDIKDYGHWTYKYNDIYNQIPYWVYGVIGTLLFMIIAWTTVLVCLRKKDIQIEIPSQIVSVDEEASNIITNYNKEYEELHIYPSVGQYTETIKLAVVTPDDYFDKLKDLRPVLDANGEPIMSSGNFAVVFKMVDKFGKYHAIRCFHREQERRVKSYKLICKELAKVSSPYLLPIQYLERELYIDSVEYPVLLMDWVEGLTLDKYIRKIINDKVRLHSLANKFRQMAIWLLNQPFAHGDLKPDNILVKEDGSLVLVDYDGMYVPAMQGQRARELGSPDFRNPSRTDTDFDKKIDTFPIVSILLSLEMLVENKDCLSKYGAEDRLLFSEEDYKNLENCMLFKIAYTSNNSFVSKLAKRMREEINGLGNSDIRNLLNKKSDCASNSTFETYSMVLLFIFHVGLIYFSLVLRSFYKWHILFVSAAILLALVFIFSIFSVIDVFRPNKETNLAILDEENTGCFGYLALIPILMMGDFFSNWINGWKLPLISELPLYNEEWYMTVLIWVSAYFIMTFYTNVPHTILSIRKSIYLTQDEKEIKKEQEEINNIRKQIRDEEEKRKRNQIRYRSYYENLDLPF